MHLRLQVVASWVYGAPYWDPLRDPIVSRLGAQVTSSDMRQVFLRSCMIGTPGVLARPQHGGSQGDAFGGHHRDSAIGLQWAEARNAAPHLTVHRTPHYEQWSGPRGP